MSGLVKAMISLVVISACLVVVFIVEERRQHLKAVRYLAYPGHFYEEHGLTAFDWEQISDAEKELIWWCIDEEIYGTMTFHEALKQRRSRLD